MHMLCAIDGSAQSIDRNARWMDLSLAQPLNNRASIDRSRCAIDIVMCYRSSIAIDRGLHCKERK